MNVNLNANSLPIASQSGPAATPAPPSQPAAPVDTLTQVQCTPDEIKQYKALMQSAIEARTHAYAPNSHSMVGSAVLARDGKVFEGANFETTIYADHGEQTAVERALAAGEAPKDLIASATFIAKQGGPTPADFKNQANSTSCGNCRQGLYEINPDMREITLAPDGENVTVYRAGDLLPKAYHRSHDPEPNTAPTTVNNPDPLIADALLARSRSFVPRTNEPVGAAVETASGHIYTGIRVETSSFATQAERMALDEALMHGEHDITRMVLVGGTSQQGEIPKTLSWDSLQAVAQLSPNAQVSLPDGNGGFADHPIAEVPGYLLSHQAPASSK